MQLILSTAQSQVLESLARQGGYPSLDDAIDTALILLANEITHQGSPETPADLAWVEQARLQLEESKSNRNSTDLQRIQ